MKQQRRIVVKKFGGTSVGSIERIHVVAQRIVEAIKEGEAPVVVASAMSGETNRLVQLASEIHSRPKGAAYDMLLASGEQVSVALLALALQELGYGAEPLLAYQLGIKTDSSFSRAKIQNVNAERLFALLRQEKIPIVAGFQGVSGEQITTMGRGGSDTTAVALAATMGLGECEVYTDVPAIFTADPKLVSRAAEISRIGFSEMMEMSSLGSQVLHFRSVELAAKYGVKIHLRSTFEKREGTWVLPEGEYMENPVVSAVTHEVRTSILKVFSLPAGTKTLFDLFEKLSSSSVVVDIITQSHIADEQRLAFSVPSLNTHLAVEIIKEIFGSDVRVEVIENMAKVSVVGVGMKTHSGVAAQFFKYLMQEDIDVHLVTTSDIKISAIVDEKYLKKAAESLHRGFGLDASEEGLNDSAKKKLRGPFKGEL